MLISCLIPTFNRATTLPRAVESVLVQDYRDIELIIIDDASTDETQNYLRELKDPRVQIIGLEVNGGVSRARNLGAQKAQGEWLAFLDSDDVWLPHKLTHQVEKAQNHPQWPLIHGEEIWVRRGVRVNPKKKHQKGEGDQFSRACELCVISPSATMMKASVFHELGGFREDFEVCEDYDLWLRYLARYEVGFVETPIIVKYGGHEDQLSNRYRAMDDWRVRSLLDLLEKVPLNNTRRKKVFEEICRKGQILLIGYDKHQRPEDCQRVQSMIERAHKIFESLP